MRVALLPIGSVPTTVLVRLSDELEGYGIRCDVRPQEELPSKAFNARRRQYRADDLLSIVEVPGADRVLAVTTADLFVEGMNFVFGLADLGGHAALVSLHRLEAGDEETSLDRLTKEAIHELGHTFGLAHCDTPRCVMRFSNTLWETDDKGRGFCDRCRRRVPLALDRRG